MNFNINCPTPYLSRKNIADRIIIDQKVNNELSRIRKLTRKIVNKDGLINKIDLKFGSHLDLNPVSPKTEIKVVSSSIKSSKIIELKNDEIITEKSAFTNSLSNVPSGTSTIGYNCTIDYITTYDYPFLGGSYDSFKMYVVFEENGIFQDYKTNGHSINNIITIEKPQFQSKINFNWTMNFDMYATATYPTSKFIIFMEKYIDGRLVEVLTTDIVTINFSGYHCINIHNLGLSASNSNGGYPSIKGGDHETEPTLTVNLNFPAPPDGQIVYLSVTGVNSANPEAWINSGMSQVTIGAGQTQGAWSGFIGSRSVLTTKTIHVKATVNGVHGVHTLKITRR